MANTKKQLKITKMFRKETTRPVDCDELQEEIRQLELQLQEKHNELFQIQRNNCRKKGNVPKKYKEPFVRPQKIVINNSIESLKRSLELMSMLTGMEVQSYVLDDHCCVVFHMQHDSNVIVKHGLRIEMTSEGNEITKSSLPVGFNLKGVLEDFDNVMMPECLRALRRALVAYYDRQEQFKSLKKLLSIEAELFKIIDGSHKEISFYAQSHTDEEDEQISITLILNYRIYDIRPKTYCFKEIDLPEGVADLLKQQCTVFKKKSLSEAFKDAFIDGFGTYKLVQQLGPRKPDQQTHKAKKFRPNKHNHNNDDTFHPDDCSDQGEDDASEE